MTKMAVMAMNSKVLKKFSRTRWPTIKRLGMKLRGEELYKIYISHHLGMTLTLTYGKENIGCPCFCRGKLVQCNYMGGGLAGVCKWTDDLCLCKNVLSLSQLLGYI